jgi:hypothetical protein
MAPNEPGEPSGIVRPPILIYQKRKSSKTQSMSPRLYAKKQRYNHPLNLFTPVSGVVKSSSSWCDYHKEYVKEQGAVTNVNYAVSVNLVHYSIVDRAPGKLCDTVMKLAKKEVKSQKANIPPRPHVDEADPTGCGQ